MTIKTHIYTLLLIFISLLLFACGGGGGGNTPITNTQQQGLFVDSLVSGLRYETPSISGFTDNLGKFNYQSGETIGFYVGDILIGETLGQAIITPIELVSGAIDENNIQVQNIVMFLQSIDEDGNESNGITITSNATNAASGQSIDFSLAQGIFETNGAIQILVSNITSSNGQARSMITRAQAKNSFRNNLLFLYTGKYEGTFNGDDTGSWSATVGANGVISGISTSTTYGSDTIAGNLSSSGKSSMNGTVGSAIFLGNFSRSGDVIGTWLDNNGASGSFNGKRTSAAPLSGNGGNNPPQGGGNFGSIIITGNDADTIGSAFAPNLAPVVFDALNITTVIWSQSIVSATEFESRTMSFRFNTDGSLYSITYLRTTSIDLNSGPTSYFDYYIDCQDTPQACTTIALDRIQQRVSYNNVSLIPSIGNNNASNAIVLNGALSW